MSNDLACNFLILHQASAQAKTLTLRSINGYDSEEELIEISVKAEPTVVQTFTQSIPQYSYEISGATSGGYTDEMQLELNKIIGDDMTDWDFQIE